MSSYQVVYEDPVHPGAPLRSQVFPTLERAQQEVQETVEEFMAVLHLEHDTVDELLEKYQGQGWRPVLISCDGGEPPRQPDEVIRTRAIAWVLGDAAARWVPPAP
ncbi:MAG TPA: hypothetical protein VF559_08435 [Caulobacteraceae bacterium]